MTNAEPRFLRRVRSRLLGFAAIAFSLAMLTGVATAGTASAWSWNDDGRIVKEYVWSDAMARNIPISYMPSARGGNHALILLDGLRARDDFSGWDIETNAFDKFRNDNINVVMPIGGQSSWYADWNAPSNINGQDFTYKWETFLSVELPNYLASQHGIARDHNAIAGLSMGGSAALYFAAKYKPYYSFAGSFSGYLHNSMIGMPAGISVGMLDAGSFNAGDMYGSASSLNPEWTSHDPFNFAPELRGISMYISAASALPNPDPVNGDRPKSLLDYYNTTNGMALEGLALANSRIFQARLDSLNIPATYSFPPVGIHSWNNWSVELDKARPQILDATNGW
ncbi:alpha/beta hydrolase [Tomitella fengzijianii]|uniref:Esterase family protein n=1 Tax=Tomitella fengzijianii TaxID=2597660 RepID=A0A516X016_9ACTN|nr:alpha/beta hydrolase family protein [Tomitella fengzijianii]QDQ96370.1 esterase family protein [Tomitella fengzijianii]